LIKVGFVQGWENEIIDVTITSAYSPSFGDLLYTRERVGNAVKTTLMEVVGMASVAPGAAAPLEVQPALSHLDVKMIAKARLFLEILEDDKGVILAKASRPPMLLTPVYLVRKGDQDSEELMRQISKYSSAEEGVSVAAVVLRSGIAHNKALAAEKYFMNASFRLNLPEILRKHVLVVGQTGSGKTSGVQGLLTKYALDSGEKVGWLIIDRHGEYTPPEGYSEDKFIGVYVDSLRTNKYLGGETRVYTYRLVTEPPRNRKYATVHGVFDIKETPVKASSVIFADFAALEEVGFERATMLEEFLLVLAEGIKYVQSLAESARSQGKPPAVNFDTQLFLRGEDVDYATANLLALVPLVADNLVRYEGVGARREDKKGIHRVLVDRGIDARQTRLLRRLVLSIMGWRTQTRFKNGKSIVVLDDSKSVIKVSTTLKNPEELACFLESLVKYYESYSRAGRASYPWSGLCSPQTIDVGESFGIEIGEIVREVDSGNTVILDVSQLSSTQADLAVLTITRRVFEDRLEAGVEVSSKKPVVSIVSEEAPLYLSTERVRTPFNPFARVAREGRKFGVGLLAITQLATMIDKQLLGNFNTFIVMRTKSSGDLNFFRDIGIPVETLPYLGDRECFVYTPDLPIKEPIPAYMPAWFDEDILKLANERRSSLKAKITIPRELQEFQESG